MAVSPYGRDVAQRHRRRVMLAIVAIAALLLAGTTFIPFPSTDPSPRANDAVLTSEGGLCAGKSLLLERRFSLKGESSPGPGRGTITLGLPPSCISRSVAASRDVAMRGETISGSVTSPSSSGSTTRRARSERTTPG